MTVRDIRLFGDPVLREPCRGVTDFGPGLARLVTDLMDTCREPGRAGLAAPQIGVDLRVFCYNVDGGEGYLINPRLTACDGDQDDLEGCLSIPGLYLPTPRAAHAIATGVGLDGQPVTVEGTGLLARCLQHEVDHLDGHLFLDRLPDSERRQALQALRSELGPRGAGRLSGAGRLGEAGRLGGGDSPGDAGRRGGRGGAGRGGSTGVP